MKGSLFMNDEQAKQISKLVDELVSLDLGYSVIDKLESEVNKMKEKVEIEEYVEYDFDGVGGYGSSGRIPLPNEYHKEVPCYDHPDAPHGFERNASHDEGHYVCECKGWFEENVDDAIYSLESLKEKMELLGIEKSIIEDTAEHNAYWKMRDDIYKQIKFMRGLLK